MMEAWRRVTAPEIIQGRASEILVPPAAITGNLRSNLKMVTVRYASDHHVTLINLLKV